MPIALIGCGVILVCPDCVFVELSTTAFRLVHHSVHNAVKNAVSATECKIRLVKSSCILACACNCSFFRPRYCKVKSVSPLVTESACALHLCEIDYVTVRLEMCKCASVTSCSESKSEFFVKRNVFFRDIQSFRHILEGLVSHIQIGLTVVLVLPISELNASEGETVFQILAFACINTVSVILTDTADMCKLWGRELAFAPCVGNSFLCFSYLAYIFDSKFFGFLTGSNIHCDNPAAET